MDHILTEHMVFAYHYDFLDPGTLYHTEFKSYPSKMFSGICVFIDHAGGYVSTKHQVSINAPEYVKVKLVFEREAQSQRVAIKG